MLRGLVLHDVCWSTPSHCHYAGAIEFGWYPESFDNLAQIIFIRHGEKVRSFCSKGLVQWCTFSLPLKMSRLQIDDDHPDLSPEGDFRANNLHEVFGSGKTTQGAYNTPDVIYAQEQKVGPTYIPHDFCLGSLVMLVALMGRCKGHSCLGVRMQTLDNSNRPYETVEPLAHKLGMTPEMHKRTVADGGVFDNTFREKEHKAGSCSCVSFTDNYIRFTHSLASAAWQHSLMRCLLAAGAQARPRGSCQG